MLTAEQDREVREVVGKSLNRAEKHWREGGHKLVVHKSRGMESLSEDAAPSRIPGHKIVKEGETVISQFVALVADMRGSTDHLLEKDHYDNAKGLPGLQRVFYETSALLPALELVVGYEGGSVTEYLGDGVLALFKVEEGGEGNIALAAYRAGYNAVNSVREIVNSEIGKRYALPSLNIGVGLSTSKAIVSLSGLEGNKHPKAFGECVFKATKLSGSNNKIAVDKNLNISWPSSPSGTLSFNMNYFEDVEGYIASS